MAYFNSDSQIETDLNEVSLIADFNIKFLTPSISVLIDDYALLLDAVKHRNMSHIQTFLWKYGISAMYGVSH